jgi:hypothetical protein
VEIAELDVAIGRSFICEIERSEYTPKAGPKAGQVVTKLDLAWAKIYHVDDPTVAHMPKDKGVIASIPKSLRHSPEYFAHNGVIPSPIKLTVVDDNSVDNL